MAGGFSETYKELWPVASISVVKVSDEQKELECPAAGCNYYKLYDIGQSNVKTFSTYVSICKKMKESGIVYDKCSVGKLLVGVQMKNG